MYFTIWNIFYSSKKSKQENYPNVDVMKQVDRMDMDGMGNFSRFPSTEPMGKRRRAKMDRDWKSRKKEKTE